MVVGEQHQFGNQEGVVEPDGQNQADAQPARRVHHQVEAELHGRAAATGRSWRAQAGCDVMIDQMD